MKLFVRQQTSFEAIKQGRMVDELFDVGPIDLATFGDFSSGDRIIKSNKDFPQIKNND
jgi:hypothetical protein